MGRKINILVVQERVPGGTSDDIEPATKECEKSNSVYLILIKEATSVVKT